MKANREKILKQLNIAKGQLNGISKMVEEDSYCIDISNQIKATIGILQNINLEILSAHLKNCVCEAAEDPDKLEEKVQELYKALEWVTK